MSKRQDRRERRGVAKLERQHGGPDGLKAALAEAAAGLRKPEPRRTMTVHVTVKDGPKTYEGICDAVIRCGLCGSYLAKFSHSDHQKDRRKIEKPLRRCPRASQASQKASHVIGSKRLFVLNPLIPERRKRRNRRRTFGASRRTRMRSKRIRATLVAF
jgi:hypothetical protein